MSTEFDKTDRTSLEVPFNNFSSVSIRSLFNELPLNEQNGPLGKFTQALWPQLLERKKVKLFQIDSENEGKESKFTCDIFTNSSDKIDLSEKDFKKILRKIPYDDETCQEMIKTLKEGKEVVLNKP